MYVASRSLTLLPAQAVTCAGGTLELNHVVRQVWRRSCGVGTRDARQRRVYQYATTLALGAVFSGAGEITTSVGGASLRCVDTP
jgi:hypothetical protein